VIALQLAATVLVPLAGAFAIRLSREHLAEAWTYASSLVGFILALSLVPAAGTRADLLEILPGLRLSLMVDRLGLVFVLLASGLWIVTSLYSSGYVRAVRLENRRRYFACFALSIAAANLIALSGNVLTMLIGMELLTIATYPLVAHDQTDDAIAAGRKYLAYALSGGLLLTIAAAWSWIGAGTLDFVEGGFLSGRMNDHAAWALLLLYLAGCGVKAAIMPLHGWLPSAMVAPAPVSALLHAVAVVKAGVFACVRVIAFVFGAEMLHGFGGGVLIFFLTAATVVAASLIALDEDKLKRRLAYSTIASLSMIVLGASLFTPHAMEGALLYFLNHAAAKITLFFCAGAIGASANREYVSELSGLAHAMPWTFGCFTIATLSLIGAPGLGLFAAKLVLARSTIEAGELVLLAVVLGSSILSAFYLLPVVRTAVFDRSDVGAVRDPPASMRVAMVATALMTLLLAFLPSSVMIEVVP
jgi:multicomponent Na+:H+ antiporter subunit D